MNDIITATTNAHIRACRALHRSKGRKASNQTLIEGPTVFAEFLGAGVLPTAVYCTPDDTVSIRACTERSIRFWLVSRDALGAASDTITAQSPVAIIDVPKALPLRSTNTVVLVDIADPGNVGTIIRSAAAFGWDVAHTTNTADLWAPKTLRAAVGGHTRTRIVHLAEPLRDLARTGLASVSSVVTGGDPPRRGSDPVALLIGSEAHGLPRWARESATANFSIPMASGSESLNAAVAASILMYTLS